MNSITNSDVSIKVWVVREQDDRLIWDSYPVLGWELDEPEYGYRPLIFAHGALGKPADVLNLSEVEMTIHNPSRTKPECDRKILTDYFWWLIHDSHREDLASAVAREGRSYAEAVPSSVENLQLTGEAVYVHGSLRVKPKRPPDLSTYVARVMKDEGQHWEAVNCNTECSCGKQCPGITELLAARE